MSVFSDFTLKTQLILWSFSDSICVLINRLWNCWRCFINFNVCFLFSIKSTTIFNNVVESFLRDKQLIGLDVTFSPFMYLCFRKRTHSALQFLNHSLCFVRECLKFSIWHCVSAYILYLSEELELNGFVCKCIDNFERFLD